MAAHEHKSLLAKRVQTLIKLGDDVNRALESESMSALDKTILRTRRLHGDWAKICMRLDDRRSSLATAARTVSVALRSDCWDEELIIEAIASCQPFAVFSADIETLRDRLLAIHQLRATAVEEIPIPGSAVAQLLPHLASKNGHIDEIRIYQSCSALARVLQALLTRAQAAKLLAEKLPELASETQAAVSTFSAPIAALASRFANFRDLLIFVKRCADPDRMDVQWLLQHMTPMRESLALLEQAFATSDAAFVFEVVQTVRRHGNGLKKTREVLGARAELLRSGGKIAECDQLSSPFFHEHNSVGTTVQFHGLGGKPKAKTRAIESHLDDPRLPATSLKHTVATRWIRLSYPEVLISWQITVTGN